MRAVSTTTRARSAVVVTWLAFLLVWLGVTAPDRISLLTPAAFVRLPLEAVVFLGVALVLPDRARKVAAGVAGVALGLLMVLKVLDMGFYEALNRPFDSVVDWTYLGSAVGLLDDALGTTAAVAVLVMAALLALALLVVVPLSLLRVASTVSRHRTGSIRAVSALAALWLLLAVLDVHVEQDAPVASTGATAYAYGQLSRIPAEIRDQHEFARAAAGDPLRSTPADRLLTGLRGKDVLFVFVESYGRVAVQGSALSRDVDAVLDAGTRRLRAAGFSSRSAFLTSPTFGAISWLAHSTLQSGLWVDSQQRYDVLVTSRRLTLSRAFRRGGWRTVADIPANTHDWPQGRFYDYDKVYDSRNVGYAGPRFGYPTMPDQYTLDALHRLELGKTHRRPVMAEIDLISSHAPWSRTPHLVDQGEVGDGSVFDGMPQRAPSKTVIWRSARRVRAAYAQSIEYSLKALLSFVTSYGNDKTVLVVLGDHQPATIVSGDDADHDVPVTLIARDPRVLGRISRWRWQDGLRPGPGAPVMRMDAFRDRFLSAYGP
jgi:hypothetical protein